MCLMEVVDNCWPVVFHLRQCPTQVSKRGHYCKGTAICPKCELSPLLCLLFCKSLVIPLHPLTHRAVTGCHRLRSAQGMNMSQLGKPGWGRLNLSRITIVSHTWRCKKCTRRLSLLITPPPCSPRTGALLKFMSTERKTCNTMVTEGPLSTVSPFPVHAVTGGVL